ncbi:hypothetical protein P168DRAFT_321309 [Aspergillus campestris IBT 28561]|uniref:DUF7708 domain-containing protein n=1 Tax=Aspergillus campestris (strain IBT 28561) TaxID=1392248 RepID=A0A2I1CVT6_ASPC2|nr:uncharacterized protein P168DRAFT_321309 [Aspergillus campestris IBT 28561]PKY01737.1 hypothetical protein P168DRAFT_321309 [Aspergillus campestris IBT 28561]
MSHTTKAVNGTKRFNDQDLTVIEKSDAEQEEFHRVAQQNNNFSKEELSALRIQSADEFERSFGSTLAAKGKFEASHRHGTGRAGRAIQNAGASAYEILQNMEPIVETVKTFAAPYGGIAIGTISFLVTVASYRARTEQLIWDTLLQIRDRAVGLKLFRDIYHDDHELDEHLQSKIVQAYNCFINFCMEAAKYYTKKGLKRWAKAAYGATALDDYASKVQDAILEVRYTSEELLMKNVDTIKKLNIDQAREIETLKAQLKQLQEGHDNDKLDEIQELLELSTYSRESELDRLRTYQTDINWSFDYDWPTTLQRMQGSQLMKFQTEKEFHTWRHSDQSSMLILVGYNNEQVCLSPDCWLSPVALDMITSSSKAEDSDPRAFYLVGHHESRLSTQVLASILIQLLRQNSQVLRDQNKYNELYAAAKKYNQAVTLQNENCRQKSGRKSNKLLQDVARHVLNLFDSHHTIWIILDRVDQCRSERETYHRKSLMKTLVYLVEKVEVRVKVLAVVNGYDWKLDDQTDELDCSNPSRVVFRTIHQQETDG